MRSETPKPLVDLTDAELQAEMDRRRKAREDAEAQRRRARADTLSRVLTREVIDALRPDHDRTTCDDERPNNGWGTRSDGGYRCTRCALLQGAPEDGYDIALVVVSVTP